MKRFFLKCLVYFGILLLSSALFLRVLVSFPNEYCFQSHEVNVVRQIKRMKTIDEPKIVIIGGSGCGFGLCSKMISEHFKMPVCNTGTHAGMGLLTQLNLFKGYICKNDIVVVIPEYSNYMKNKYLGDVANLRILSSTYPIGYKSFSLRQQLYLLQYVPFAFDEARKSRNAVIAENNPYSRNSLNEYGDVEMYEIRHHLDTIDWKPKKWDDFRLQNKTISLLQDFYQYCKCRNATMLLFPPAYKEMYFDTNQEYITMIWNALEEAQLSLVSSPERYRMADTLYYDTEYHLIYEGVKIRTQMLIADMDAALRIYNDIQN